MARGTQLRELIDMLRSELGVSIDRNSSLNTLDSHKIQLRSAQRWLYENYDWPLLNVRRDKTLQAGQRFYDFDPDLPFENVRKVEVLWGSEWLPVEYGIGSAEYNHFEEGARTDPVRRWQVYELQQYEVWPTPASQGKLRMWGKARIPEMVEESSPCTLDDLLIVYYAAMHLARDTEKFAERQQIFQTHLNKVRSNTAAATSKPFILGGGTTPRPVLRPGLDYIPGR